VSAVVALVVVLGGWLVSSHHGSGSDGSDGSDGSGGSSYGSGATGDAGKVGTDSRSGLPYVDLSTLPKEAAQTVTLIDEGGPFPYPDHDGGTFSNYEGVLPQESSGYYREYTVPTPGSPDRGTRRIISGADGTLYWTGDHYEHFAVIKR